MPVKLITILGPTAVGKTKLATTLASQIDGELISADSRQIYRGMDIGTGKDLRDFKVNKIQIPHHLIDIRDAGEEYDVFKFQNDFYQAYQSIIEKGKIPILCGGTGMYLQAALAKDRLVEVPANSFLRSTLAMHRDEELVEILKRVEPDLHNTTDLKDRGRMIRAIEIAQYKQVNPEVEPSPVEERIVFGVQMQREALRKRIKARLEDRLKEGMIEEVESLLEKGISHEQLDYYGLEYRFISKYLQNELTQEEFFEGLLQAIRRFAKKQMTWFRRMEKQGTEIIWIDAELDMEEKLKLIHSNLK